MAKHKWHKEIKAWADGVEIEIKYLEGAGSKSGWMTMSSPDWDCYDVEYRIKLQPKEPQYLYAYHTTKGIELGYAPHEGMNMYNTKLVGKIKLEADDDTSGT